MVTSMSRALLPTCLTVLALTTGMVWPAGVEPLLPLPIDEAGTALRRWLDKPVFESRLLDGMEQTNHWAHPGRGEMAFTTERAREGKRSVRLVCSTRQEAANQGGRPWGECVARREFEAEDWGEYNRLSFWVYPHLPGFKVLSMLVRLRNDGAVKVPDGYNREGLNYFLLKPDQWNHVVWEIPHLARDRVTAVEFVYRQQGNEPGATNRVCYDLDQLELQRVAADPYEGWMVAPGQIAYSHSGYLVNASKTALAAGLSRDKFRLVEEKTASLVLTKPIQKLETPTGEFGVFDFSEFNTPGIYHLEAGRLRTPSFPIGDAVWRNSVLKTINFFYCERCGTAIPGIHDLCHQDWRASHNGTNLLINGGWHDAGDLSQGLINTAEATYAMLQLGEALRPLDPELSRRLFDEARWGLTWLHKTRFGDGARVTWATMDFWTDGVLGNADDMTVPGQNSPYDNFTAAATEGMAARVLKTRDPAWAGRSLQAAEEDWRFALEKLKTPSLELAAAGALASLELFKATGGKAYADKAVDLARVILESQQRELTAWRMPLAGFFYTGPKRERMLHYAHRGHEQAPVVVLAGLCRALPDHPDWMKWYSAVVLHSEYLRRTARLTEPYGMLCASVYALDESNDPRFQEQVRQGIPLSDRHYLRRFPVWFDFRGNSGTVLSQTKALSAAARLRNHAGLHDLVQKQLQWHVGRNPFCQSLMFGEGHDYAPQYTALSGDLAGSLPVGVQTRVSADVPYWPAANCYNYKEVWVHPSSRWLWIMSDVLTPPRSPQASPEFSITSTEDEGEVRIRVAAPAGAKVAFAIRGSNLRFDDSAPGISRSVQTQTLVWTAQQISRKEPWVALVVPGKDVSQALEAVGGWPEPVGSKP
jgi:hypothetical protein